MNSEKITNIIHQYSKKHNIIGLAVLIIKDDKSHTFFTGEMKKGTNNTVNKNSLFEIGSITKLFTNLLFKKISETGKISLDNKVSDFLPDMKSVGSITIRQLITHTSGLPRLPKNLKPKNISNPYREYTEQDLENFLKLYKNEKTPGEIFEYSNVGYALLSYILIKIENTSYENILKINILQPLGMEHTYIHIPKKEYGFLAQGYNSDGNKISLWNQEIFVGAGGIVSNISDMEKFLKWNMAQSEPLLAFVKQKNIFWHNGMTGGYASFLAFNIENKTGLVILANTAKSVDNLAKEIFGNLKL